MAPGTPSPLTAVREVADFLESKGIPYVIIGGLAVQYWGEPRATRDVDVTVLVPEDSAEDFMQEATRRFPPRLEDAVDFARRSRMLLLRTEDGVPIDMSLGIPGYEEAVMGRAVTVPWPGGGSIRLIGCEDLIIHKCVAGRPRDMEDVRTILERRRGRVDVAYVRKWLADFAALLPDKDIVGSFEKALASLTE